jgi:hypothetical protein
MRATIDDEVTGKEEEARKKEKQRIGRRIPKRGKE